MDKITEIKKLDLLFKKNQRINNQNTIEEAKKIIIEYLEKGEEGQTYLLDLLINRRLMDKECLSILDGIIFDYLKKSKLKKIQEKINKSFPEGIFPLKTSLKNNYSSLQKLLVDKKFKEADQLTQQHLCKLAGLDKYSKRNWLYFTDISYIPSEDLFTLDMLWQIYSEGKFGFSIQRKIWILNNYNWNKLWQKIGWIKQGTMRRYPQEFIWNINAPIGHLPLFNQLRGNQVLLSLFEHIAWNTHIEIK
uniref:GUN4-like domain-containing protein n=1 Tax=Spermothamnion repens TaxID=31383 RepID=A0A4D6WYM0_9FLOR|nr:hypothetical protein [Spermothamnion repens]